MKSCLYAVIFGLIVLLGSCVEQPKIPAGTYVYPFARSKAVTYIYQFHSPDQEAIVSFQVLMTTNGEMIVRSFDEKKETNISLYQYNGDILFTRYYKNGKWFLASGYDYQNKKISLTGMNTSSFDLKPIILEQNGCLPLILSRYLKPKGEILIFSMLQSPDNRLVEMYFKEVERVQIGVLGKVEKAVKYEMGLRGNIESKLWPYKYYYWYRESDNLFVKFHGINEKRMKTTLTLKTIL